MGTQRGPEGGRPEMIHRHSAPPGLRYGWRPGPKGKRIVGSQPGLLNYTFLA